ncbi:MAG: hypothetical protein BWK80_53910 [Desulfobacteraceae bacterium IS3]|nr:MAG: hypothetical protein BWK80_53910 [Desulfobacteraceae bacterium IS3]
MLNRIKQIRSLYLCAIILAVCLFAAISQSDITNAQANPELVDLSLWTEMDYASDGSSGDWRVSEDGLTVTQYINAAPTFYISNFDLIPIRFQKLCSP